MSFLRVIVAIATGVSSLALAGEIPRGVLDRFDRLSSFSVEYVRTTVHDPDPNLVNTIPADRRAAFVKPEARIERATETFRYAGSRAEYTTAADQDELEAALKKGFRKIAKETIVVGPDRGESMAWHFGARTAVGGVTDSESLPIPCFADVALGRRLMRSSGFLARKDLDAMHAATEQSGDVVLKWRDSFSTIHTMRYGSKVGFAMVSYKREYPEPNTWEEISCSDFREVKGVWIPFHVEKDTVYTDSGGQLRHPFRSVLEIKSFVLDPEENKGDGLRMHWPKGASVRDRRTNLLTEIARDQEVITDERWYQLLKEHDAAELQETKELEARLRGAATRRSVGPSEET